MTIANSALLQLLQLSSPALPVGAYSYSEGLETLVQQGRLSDAEAVYQWLVQELRYGAVRLEAAVLLRCHQAMGDRNFDALQSWNQWLSAARETAELRHQSWQMGRSLGQLLQALSPALQPAIVCCQPHCNFATAFAIAAAHWEIEAVIALLGYLQSWASSLVNAAVKLVPLGQTRGQQLLLKLGPDLESAVENILLLQDADLASSGWGLAIASMQHETLYSRLFRS
ncbi:MAG: urease accessory protein UreF [Leptolyngbyaceae cyanobacterium SM1_1_3]|nr:urease accessory protein UreF [Leptolyngbyaceae cyanobacterium SM1_1_3]NJN04805.1 urease accessory protein UreF [Leptolyngbyaceae cyanobacterium RM1_1_2]